MYTPPAHEEKDLATLRALVRTNPLGAWVTPGPNGLVANHIPFLLETEGDCLFLQAHVARANPVWREMSTTARSIVMFTGPQSYISPSWYPSKHADGKAVPTWNYAVVHVHGVPRAIDEAGWLRAHLERMTDTQEAFQSKPWRVDDAPEAYLDKMIGGIVGIEIPVDGIEGKWKLSQNRTVPDRLGVVAGLLARGEEQPSEVAALVQGTLV